MPGVSGVTASQLIARLPQGMLSLAILIDIQTRTGSYALAGGVVACVSGGQAIAMPFTARLVTRIGATPVLSLTSVINSASIAALAFRPWPSHGLIVLGVLVGASIPPIMPVLRALYPQMVTTDAVRALFALDTTAQELIWIIGPVIATFLSTATSSVVPLYLAAVVTLTGTGWLLTHSPVRHLPIRRATSTSLLRLLAGRAIALAMIAEVGLVASFMALEVCVVADLAGHGSLIGVALAVSGAGSLIGGLTLGHRRMSVHTLTALMMVIVAGTAGTATAPTIWWQCVALFFAGFGFARPVCALSRGLQ